ncbi:MAG: ribonuclease III [Candidatus Campbellbacteria bacterium]|nr:ribonuclease III [Candidatus Campbellbacteria bacterium]
MKDISKFEEQLGVNFNDKDILLRAFVHRSYVNENRDFTLGHNERLEFLGDAVLELVVTEELYKRFPNKNEGELTAIRAAVVNTKSLSSAAKKLKMGDFLFLSKGESKSTGRARSYILANTFESVVGAIYIDQGYKPAKKFIGDNLFEMIEPIVTEKLWVDAKSLFQEKAQEIHGTTPEYKVISESGPDHDKKFTMGVYLDNKLIGKGSGSSKQDAEQEAAEAGLKENEWI